MFLLYATILPSKKPFPHLRLFSYKIISLSINLSLFPPKIITKKKKKKRQNAQQKRNPEITSTISLSLSLSLSFVFVLLFYF